jgi:hypothetical protein
MSQKQEFGTATIARCNRCNVRGHLDRAVTRVRENSRAWRLQDMAKVSECGHLDGHWVYDADNERKEV